MKFLPGFMIVAMLVPGVVHAEPAAEPMARTEKLFIRRTFLVGDSRPAFPAAQVARQRSTGRKVLGGVVGAVGGFFGGGYLGSKLEPDCNCDDPGVMGFLIGAPIGAVVGGILGAKFF